MWLLNLIIIGFYYIFFIYNFTCQFIFFKNEYYAYNYVTIYIFSDYNKCYINYMWIIR